MEDKPGGIRKLFSKRSALIINLVLLLLVGWGFAGEFVRGGSMREEIEQLELQAAGLEERNVELAKQAERYAGSSMLEREARLKLNLKKPGEEVVVVQDTDPAALVAHSAEEGGEGERERGGEVQTDESNFRQWLKYFFPKLFVDSN